MKLHLLLLIIIFQSISCSSDNKVSLLFSDAHDETYFNAKNWFKIYKPKEGFRENDKVSIKFNFSIAPMQFDGKAFFRGDVLYVVDKNNGNVPLFDFTIKPCKTYSTFNGNTITLICKFPILQIKDSCFVYYFKLPYSISDAYFQDRALVFVGKHRGILGTSDFNRDSLKMKIVKFVGDASFLVPKYIDNHCF